MGYLLEADMYKRFELSDEISTDALEKKITQNIGKHKKASGSAELTRSSDSIRKNKVRKATQTVQTKKV